MGQCVSKSSPLRNNLEIVDIENCPQSSSIEDPSGDQEINERCSISIINDTDNITVTVISEIIREPKLKVILKKPTTISSGPPCGDKNRRRSSSVFDMNFGQRRSSTSNRISSTTTNVAASHKKQVSFLTQDQQEQEDRNSQSNNSSSRTKAPSKFKSFTNKLSRLPIFNQNTTALTKSTDNSLIISNFPNKAWDSTYDSPSKSLNSPTLKPFSNSQNNTTISKEKNNLNKEEKQIDTTNTNPLKELEIIRQEKRQLRNQFFSLNQEQENITTTTASFDNTFVDNMNNKRPSQLPTYNNSSSRRQTFAPCSSTSYIPKGPPIVLDNITNKNLGNGSSSNSNGVISAERMPLNNDFIPASEFFSSTSSSNMIKPNQNNCPKLIRRETAPAQARPLKYVNLKYGYGFQQASANSAPIPPSIIQKEVGNSHYSLFTGAEQRDPSPAAKIGTRLYAPVYRGSTLSNNQPTSELSSIRSKSPSIDSRPPFNPYSSSLSLPRPKQYLNGFNLHHDHHHKNTVEHQNGSSHSHSSNIAGINSNSTGLVRQRAAVLQSKIKEESEKSEKSFEKSHLNTSNRGRTSLPSYSTTPTNNHNNSHNNFNIHNKSKTPLSEAERRNGQHQQYSSSKERRIEISQINNQNNNSSSKERVLQQQYNKQQRRTMTAKEKESKQQEVNLSSSLSFHPLSRDTSSSSYSSATSSGFHTTTTKNGNSSVSVPSATTSTTSEHHTGLSSDSEFFDDEISDQPNLTLMDAVILSPSSSEESFNSSDLMLDFNLTGSGGDHHHHLKNNLISSNKDTGSLKKNVSSCSVVVDNEEKEKDDTTTPTIPTIDLDINEFLSEFIQLRKQLEELKKVCEEGEEREKSQNLLIQSLRRENEILRGSKKCTKCLTTGTGGDLSVNNSTSQTDNLYSKIAVNYPEENDIAGQIVSFRIGRPFSQDLSSSDLT